jgi:ABC-type uncharacterized transport system ATPase component
LEWAYSFVDGLKKYSKEKLVIRVFKDMLDGNAVPEVLYEVCVLAKKREMAKAHARARERERERERERMRVALLAYARNS